MSRRIARQTVTPSSPGQHQIEHDQIERLGAREAQSLVAVADGDGRQAFERQVQRDEVADVRLVFDDEHPRARRVPAPRVVRIHAFSVAAADRARAGDPGAATVSSQPRHRPATTGSS